jgi:competence protein CoiA
VDRDPSFCQYHIVYLIICNTFMAFYAIDEDDLVYAPDAIPRKTYWCAECFGPVRRRVGKNLAHFYHVQTPTRCRLYSKSEDHLLAQLQIQKILLPQTIVMEVPFPKIGRIADLLWEKEKIVFEIQCSAISEVEAKNRIVDYRSLGYEVIWLLDDKQFNKKTLKPAEKFLRSFSAYYISIRHNLHFEFYDQFEVFLDQKRVRKSPKMPLNLAQVLHTPKSIPSKRDFPNQINRLNSLRYFKRSRLDCALTGKIGLMRFWKTMEITCQKKKPYRFFQALQKLTKPYVIFLEKLIQKAST